MKYFVTIQIFLNKINKKYNKINQIKKYEKTHVSKRPTAWVFSYIHNILVLEVINKRGIVKRYIDIWSYLSVLFN